MASSPTHLPAVATVEDISAVLDREGAVVVDDMLGQARLEALNREFDDVIGATVPGIRHPTLEVMIEFFGRETIRLDGLPAKSETFTEVMLLPPLLGVADHYLLPNCIDYLFNTGQLIEIGPGQSAQRLHRDEDAWAFMPRPKPELEIEAMFALSDFMAANGATRVVPGSHLWPPEREPEPHEILQAEMTAGSALVYLGSTLHGGGANTTASTRRRGMFVGYVVGWLRAEENMFLTVPIERARALPRRAQELLGYKAHRAIGVVDVGSPMKLMEPGP